jgi:cytochrome c oxidase subunit 2
MEKILGLPVLASEHGKNVDNLIIYTHYLMLVLFIGWLAYFCYVLLRFNRFRNPKADYMGVKNHASNYIEGLVILAEAVLLIGFAVPLWAKAVDQFPSDKEATVIQVMAQQFAWNARYPGKDGVFGKQDAKFSASTNIFGIDYSDTAAQDDVSAYNELHVPVNKPVIVHLSSMDVIHSMKVIAFRVTQDAIPGMKIPFWFKPTQTGRFQINCAQLCGNGHSAMAGGYFVVDTPENYEKWMAEKSKSGGGSTSFE